MLSCSYEDVVITGDEDNSQGWAGMVLHMTCTGRDKFERGGTGWGWVWIDLT